MSYRKKQYNIEKRRDEDEEKFIIKFRDVNDSIF